MRLPPLPFEEGPPITDRVDWSIRVVWPDGQVSVYDGIDLTVPQAAERLEVLVDELRAAVVLGTQEPTR
jgi:hypothetical protein